MCRVPPKGTDAGARATLQAGDRIPWEALAGAAVALRSLPAPREIN